jgi:hypothetical protein
MKAAYVKYRSRGFEILGMDVETHGASTKGVKKFVARRGLHWTQATQESIKEIVEKRLRVSIFPTKLLLDPQGKIIIADDGKLVRNQLPKTLEKLLPTK